MHIELINTGSELLLGDRLNTHATWIGGRLLEEGVCMARQVSVPDGDVIREVLQEAFARADVIICTGGLGPTADDITREITAQLLDVSLTINPQVEAHLQEYFARRGKKYSSANARQAMVPDGAVILWNEFGTAPGLYFPAGLKKNSPHLFLLPGPPREMRPMFEKEFVSRLRQWLPQRQHGIMRLKITGLGESEIAAKIQQPLEAIGGFDIGYCLGQGDVMLRCIGDAEKTTQAKDIAKNLLGNHVFSEQDELLESVLVRLFQEKKLRLAIAESCTGGNVAHRITNISGASAVLDLAVVTYSNEAKHHIIGVPTQLLEQHGAVSSQVAMAMAEGVLAKSGADFAVAITGIAGPTGGSDAKPVGTVFFGIASKTQATQSSQALYSGGRDLFKILASQRALDLLRRSALGMPLSG